MVRELIQPKSVHSTAGVGYSHVAKVGNTLYIAGQVALDINGNLVGKDNIEAQAQQVYANLHAILEEMGGGLNDIVKMTTYLTDSDNLVGFRRVRNRVFVHLFPPNTLLFVRGLAKTNYLIEVEAIAVLSSPHHNPNGAP